VSVEEMFGRNEATVLRRGQEVIVRLHGLKFRVGRSNIEPQHYELLAKLQDAIRLFPSRSITIEGHTDAYGTDEDNLRLSTARAEAVRKYISANLQLDPSRLTAVGLGESAPIASNETLQGRSMNRRIDVVLRPEATAMLGSIR
jgi:outer membrane protein OmpA-like peptidoglycan-associated protein